jgi:DNA replication ATP-dependent helicase Dna2
MMNFLTENNDDATLNRRLNVAITRARSKLILIGNKYVLSQDKVYRNLINYLEDKNCIFDYKAEKQLELDLIL